MPGMGEAPPPPVLRAAAAFGLDPGRLRGLGGKSGSAWQAGNRVLRVASRARMATELAASAAAAAVLPVPVVVDRAEVADTTAVLLDLLPGQPAAMAALEDPARARAVGQACGAVHARLAAVPAPARLPVPPLTAGADATVGLLHLDLHPLNILVDGAEVSGVLDWANAARGDPVRDQARSWAILNLDPFARTRRDQPGWHQLMEGWAESAALGAVPGWARMWACQFMLADLAGRYPAGQLAHVREALRHAAASTQRDLRLPADGGGGAAPGAAPR